MILKGTKEPVPGLVWDREIWIARKLGNKIPDWFLTSRIPADALQVKRFVCCKGLVRRF